jgi:hypothetical protein
MLKKLHAVIPNDLREHAAAKDKPGTVGFKKKKDTVIYAK